MADDEAFQNIENIKSTVRQSFARIYASLKARELKTLRQLDALRKQCEDNKELAKKCVQNIKVSYENESTLLKNVSSYGIIDFEALSFDGAMFSLEDYVTPNDDHMYSYKTLEELLLKDSDQLHAIEEDALKQITSTKDCTCHVNIKSEDVPKKFRNFTTETDLNICKPNILITSVENNVADLLTNEEDKSDSSIDSDVKKIEPTEEWMNSIKSQTETEPTQASDVMEHSTITCS